MKHYDIAIIGGGVGGLNITSAAAQLGYKVALIEKEKLGGDCLWHGCVPSKTFIKSAKVMHYIKQAQKYGIKAQGEFSLKDIMQHVQDTIKVIEVHDDPERFRKMGADVFFGEPSFVSPNEIKLADKKITAKKFVIATGSSPAAPDVQGLKEAGYIDNTKVFHMQELPKKLVVLGGGPIGLELAQSFLRLGSEVHVIVRSNRILKKEDPEIARTAAEYLAEEGINFHFKTQTLRVEKNNDQKVVTIKTEGEDEEVIRCDEILVATGRTPNVEGLHLDQAGIKTNENGIIVNDKLQTSQKHIYACGDVIGHHQFTHVAEYHAGIIVSNILFKFPKKLDYRVVPWVTFTDPEVARVGITKEEAVDKKIKHKVLKYEFKNNDRAITDAQTKGFVKLIVSPNEKILGAHLIGPSAGELLHEFALAMKADIKISHISQMIHVYPTLSQVAKRTVNVHYGDMLFSDRTKKVVNFLKKF